jgi:uncharacterized protein YwqG
MTSWGAPLTALFRPAARLFAGVDGKQSGGYLGGNPVLPPATDWPMWPGHGPLTFIASVNCADLPLRELDIPLPADGTLLFFYFDGQLDGGNHPVYCEDPETMTGTRVIFIPAGVPVKERATPEGLTANPKIGLSSEVVATAPHGAHALLRKTFSAGNVSPEDRPSAQVFGDVVQLVTKGPLHQIGGFAYPIRCPVESEVAQTALGGKVPWHDPRLATEATRWVLLAQIDIGGDMMRGGVGALYWLIRPDDLANRRFDAALFTWQRG